MRLFLRLLHYVRPYWLRFGGAVGCSALFAGFTLAYAKLVEPMVDEVLIVKDPTWLILVPVLLMMVTVGKGVASYGQAYLMTYVGARVVADIRQQLFDHLLQLPLSFHLRNPSSHMLSRVINDVHWMQNSIASVLKDLVQNGFTFFALMGYVFYLNWRLAFVAMVVLPLTIYPIIRFGRQMRAFATRGQERTADMSLALQEMLTGIRVVKGFCQEDREAQRFGEINRGYFRTWMKSTQVSAITSPVLETIGVIGVAVILWYGGAQVLAGEMKAGAFVSFFAAVFLMYAPIRRIAGANNSIQQGLAAATRVFAVLEERTETALNRGAKNLAGVKESIELHDVSFRYPGHETFALSHVSLVVRPGEVLALVGSSGAGKTTLVNLVPRFFEPSSGKITIDGVDLREIALHALRRNIGIVSQETLLFDASIKENIAYGKPDSSEGAVVEAAVAAYADDFIRELPEGYGTLIGENGVKLSGGQRQRIAIARAILKDPPILILDEATSALDSESERKVQLALSNLMRNRTTFVIAHRLSTVQHADRIAVLERGRVVELGSHEDLIRRGGPYQRLSALQFQGELLKTP